MSIESVIRIAVVSEMKGWNLVAKVTEIIENVIEVNSLMPECKSECRNKYFIPKCI
jgi:hypothetical protein